MLAFRKSHDVLVDGELEFLSTNQDLLAFTRTKGKDKFLFVFNLTRKPGHFTLPAAFKGLKAVAIPGFNPAFDGKAVDLAALDAFCGKI